jgi:hypothetical protein
MIMFLNNKTLSSSNDTNDIGAKNAGAIKKGVRRVGDMRA